MTEREMSEGVTRQSEISKSDDAEPEVTRKAEPVPCGSSEQANSPATGTVAEDDEREAEKNAGEHAEESCSSYSIDDVAPGMVNTVERDPNDPDCRCYWYRDDDACVCKWFGLKKGGDAAVIEHDGRGGENAPAIVDPEQADSDTTAEDDEVNVEDENMDDDMNMIDEEDFEDEVMFDDGLDLVELLHGTRPNSSRG